MHNRMRNLGLLSLTGMLALGLVTLVWVCDEPIPMGPGQGYQTQGANAS